MFLDDVRQPPEDVFGIIPWIVIRNVRDGITMITYAGWPTEVSFDHDLGPNEPSGMDFAKFLVEEDLDHDTMPENFTYKLHSSNPPGRDNIDGLLGQYLKLRKSGPALQMLKNEINKPSTKPKNQ
jgi:hypothetical protein